MNIKKETIGNATLYLGDCLEILPTLEKVDAVITDPPYGVTANKWDCEIDLDIFWRNEESNIYIFTASQPFSSRLVMSNPKLFKHEWIWIKNRGSNFANTVREPFKEHESVLVFSHGGWVYNPQMQQRTGGGADRVKYEFHCVTESENYRKFDRAHDGGEPDKRVPSSWQKFNTETGLHPTQKPEKLFNYLIRTYSNLAQTIRDPFMGSGTTGVACMNLGRKFIGIEIEEKCFDIACERIEQAQKQGRLFA